MADRLTQLQDAVNAQADNLCNSIGILQQTSQPSPLSGGKGGQPLDTDHTQLFAQMIARTGKDIEVLIDSLPGEESTAELQAAGLTQLEQESELAGKWSVQCTAEYSSNIQNHQSVYNLIIDYPPIKILLKIIFASQKYKRYKIQSKFS